MASNQDTPRASAPTWKWVAVVLASSMVPFWAYWGAFAHDSATRAYVDHAIDSRTPYVKDRPLILYRLDQLRTDLHELQGQVKTLQRAVDQIAFVPFPPPPPRPAPK